VKAHGTMSRVSNQRKARWGVLDVIYRTDHTEVRPHTRHSDLPRGLCIFTALLDTAEPPGPAS